MTSPADDIPDVERLLRNVLRLAFEQEHGSGWLTSLSSKQQQAIDKTYELARSKRPDDPLRDAWDAAGLNEIAGVLRSQWPDALGAVWSNIQEADVDIGRLIEFRGKNLHAVGPPSGQVSDAETAAILLRLRVRLEAVRRNLLDEAGSFWPYIAAMHSNISEFCFERSQSAPMVLRAKLIEGDLVTLDVVGIHPSAGPDRLRYRLRPSVGYGTLIPETEWTTDRSFSFNVPRAPRIEVVILVADEDELQNAEGVILQADVRPMRK